jgi:predicted esterase
VIAASLAIVAALVAGDPAPRAKRADLGRSYLALERAVDGKELAPDRRREMNRRVDRVAGLFFTNRFAEAMRLIAEVVAEVEGLAPEATAEYVAASLHRASVDPPVRLAAETGPSSLRVESLMAGLDLPPEAKLRIVVPAGEPVMLDARAESISLGEWRLGRHEIELVAAQGVPAVPIGAFEVVARRPEAVAAELSGRLDAVTTAHPQDLDAVRSRLGLLTASPSPSRSIEFLSDQAAIAAECERDVAAIEAGDSPFVDRRDDHWRTVSAGKVKIPVRVAAGEGANLPLVIALHGAGGDENMFFSGYGNGLLKRLARERNLVAVTPFTPTFMASPLLLDAIVDEMVRCYGIDRSRVLMLGHSLGAGAAGSITGLRPEVPAGVAFLAGPAPVPPKPLEPGAWPPMLACIAELDGVIPAASIARSVEIAKSRGAPIEVRNYPDEGHTLMVGACLGEAVDFLLRSPSRSRPGRPEDAAATPGSP